MAEPATNIIINMTKEVLLIEPDLPLAKTYATALQAADFTVRVSADAQAAIHEVDTRRPDVIILELQLADHNGVEFLYELRSYPEWQNIPVIILSQLSEREIGIGVAAMHKLGIVHYAYKPQTSLEDLLSILQTELVLA